MKKIKVLIVDDDPDWVKEMVKYLNMENDIIVIGTAFNKEQAIKVANDIDIDVILMDINLSGDKCDGIIATMEINKSKQVNTIMLTSLYDKDIIINSFAAGAKNYISKLKYKEIPDIIRSVHKSDSPLEVLLSDYSRMKEEAQIKELTPKEKEVYKLVEEGYTRTQIQEKLMKSENTLKNQLKTIYKKLRVRSSKEAVEKVKSKGVKELKIKK